MYVSARVYTYKRRIYKCITRTGANSDWKSCRRAENKKPAERAHLVALRAVARRNEKTEHDPVLASGMDCAGPAVSRGLNNISGSINSRGSSRRPREIGTFAASLPPSRRRLRIIVRAWRSTTRLACVTLSQENGDENDKHARARTYRSNTDAIARLQSRRRR